ncbi:MAG: hypothetical protein ACJA01_000531 [Saprospiraceae bacterium]|jgi:hypothetical protein
MDNINWLSMFLATVAPMFIGFFYYHKAVFGNAWMDSIGIADEKAKMANVVVTFAINRKTS